MRRARSTGPGDGRHRSPRELGSPLSAARRDGAARGGGGGGEEGGEAAVGRSAAGVVQLPIPSHEIGPRGPHVAPGTFKVTLEVDGVAGESRTFDVRADPASAVTLAQHKAREAFVVEVMELQAKVETLAEICATRRAAATGDAAARLQALEQRLVGARGARRWWAVVGTAVAHKPVRQRLGGLINGVCRIRRAHGNAVAADDDDARRCLPTRRRI